MYQYLSDEAVVKYEPYLPMDLAQTGAELDCRIASDEMIAVEEKSTGKLIGNIYLGKQDFDTLELGYVFNRRYWGRGMPGRAVKC